MRRSRWTLRALMAGVAVVGVAIGSGMEYMRLSALAAGYRAKAIKHAETRDAINQICKPTDPLDISAGPGIRSKRFTAREVVELEASLSRKYDRAARRPWNIRRTRSDLPANASDRAVNRSGGSSFPGPTTREMAWSAGVSAGGRVAPGIVSPKGISTKKYKNLSSQDERWMPRIKIGRQ